MIVKTFKLLTNLINLFLRFHKIHYSKVRKLTLKTVLLDKY